MSAKTTIPEQHDVLHYYWPNNCCLCGHELKIFQLEKEIEQLRKDLKELSHSSLEEGQLVDCG